MRTIMKAGLAVATLATASLGAIQPAQARDHTGTAIAVGLIGLGVGAAIASSDRGYDSGYTNVGYYGGRGYYGGGYYAPAYTGYYARPVYRYGYDRGRGWDRGRDRGRWDRGYRDNGRRGWDRDRDGRRWR
jgi:hypothetical protein